MGITTTWGLRFPDGNQFPDAAQLKDLAQDIDGALTTLKNQLAAPMLAYTPTINFNCGTNVGYYKRVGGSNLVHAQFKQIVAANQFPTGSPMLTFGLPIAALIWDDIVGHGFVMKSGVLITVTYAGIAPGAVGAWRQVTSGSYVVGDRIGGTTWGSWAVGDKFYASLTYRAAS